MRTNAISEPAVKGLPLVVIHAVAKKSSIRILPGSASNTLTPEGHFCQVEGSEVTPIFAPVFSARPRMIRRQVARSQLADCLSEMEKNPELSSDLQWVVEGGHYRRERGSATEARSISSTPNTRCSGTRFLLCASFITISTAATPISYFGCRIVVRGG